MGRSRIGLRFGSRIALKRLKEILPRGVTRFKSSYGILSKGIHELGEDECKRYFPVLRAAIVRILEQDLQAQMEQAAEEELERQLKRIEGDLRGAGGGPSPAQPRGT